jgi:hypothetical protein
VNASFRIGIRHLLVEGLKSAALLLLLNFLFIPVNAVSEVLNWVYTLAGPGFGRIVTLLIVFLVGIPAAFAWLGYWVPRLAKLVWGPAYVSSPRRVPLRSAPSGVASTPIRTLLWDGVKSWLYLCVVLLAWGTCAPVILLARSVSGAVASEVLRKTIVLGFFLAGTPVCLAWLGYLQPRISAFFWGTRMLEVPWRLPAWIPPEPDLRHLDQNAGTCAACGQVVNSASLAGLRVHPDRPWELSCARCGSVFVPEAVHLA